MDELTEDMMENRAVKEQLAKTEKSFSTTIVDYALVVAKVCSPSQRYPSNSKRALTTNNSNELFLDFASPARPDRRVKSATDDEGHASNLLRSFIFATRLAL